MKRKINKKAKYKTILRVAQVSVLRGIHNVHQLAELTGISYPRTKKLWEASENVNSKPGKNIINADVKIELEDIDLLCEGLNCKVKDIIVRVPISS